MKSTSSTGPVLIYATLSFLNRQSCPKLLFDTPVIAFNLYLQQPTILSAFRPVQMKAVKPWFC